MPAIVTDNQPDYRQEVRSRLFPFLTTLAMIALLVVMLAASLFFAFRIISIALALAILTLIAFCGFRISAVSQSLGAIFSDQIQLQQEHLSALRRRHFLLSATLSGVGDAVIAADIGGRITFLNPVAEKLTAWQEEDAIGREVKTVLTLVDDRTGEAMPDPATEILAASLKLDFPPRAAQIARTGELRPINGSGTPIWEENGKMGGVALVFRDISERRGAAESLQDMKAHRESSEARAEAILETALDCIVLMREGGEIAGFNPAAERVFGWTSSQALDKSAADLLFPASSRNTFWEAARHSQTVKTSAIRADGREFPAEMTITPIPRQAAPLYAIHLQDISDRQEADAVLRLAQKNALAAALLESREKSALLANMSDELRTPLNAVIGYSEMLQEEANDRQQSDLVPDLQRIHGAGRHLLSLINDILDLSKIEAGQMELYPETFEVAPMLEEVKTSVQATLNKNENTLLVRAASDLGMMSGDRLKVKQSLLNLLSNAAGFSHGRTVALDAVREHDHSGDWITFRLADASADHKLPLHQQLSETVHAAEPSGSPRFSGHGLALVIARHLCLMHGGEFTGSRDPGHGAVYKLRFPSQ